MQSGSIAKLASTRPTHFTRVWEGLHVFLLTFPRGNVCMIFRARYGSHVFPRVTLVAQKRLEFRLVYSGICICGDLSDSALVFSLSKHVGISDGIETSTSDCNKIIPSTNLILLSTNPSTDGQHKDCSAAAGLERRQIPDEQVSASSFINGHHPSQGRLNNEVKQVNGSTLWGSWCAKTEDIFQYIQVLLHTSFMC